MNRDKWVWMPHAGHFICDNRCRFHLNTCVGKFIVSTVGELVFDRNKEEFETVGLNRLYETMVFRAKKSENRCCPFEMNSDELDFMGYNKAEDAFIGHLKLCNKWSKK